MLRRRLLQQLAPAAVNATSLKQISQAKAKSTTNVVLTIAVCASFAVVSILAGLIYYKYTRQRQQPRRRRRQQSGDASIGALAHQQHQTQSEKSASPSESILPAIIEAAAPKFVSGQRIFTYEQLQTATDSFSLSNVIGYGGFGSVYRGVLAEGLVVAIKQLEFGGKQGEDEFRVEIDMLSRAKAPQLLELIGYCADDDHCLLVYEFMSNGNLQEHLYPQQQEEDGVTRVRLSWQMRMKIALDAAMGLEYLHELMTPPIIHRDFKCSNILLDDKLNAKLSDFGLAKIGSNKVYGDVSTRVLGTHGYVAPEYVMTGHLTTKSDVYSYGVVLLEMLTGRVPVDMKRPPGEGILVSWALPRLSDRDKVEEIIDPSLKGQYSMKELIQVAAIAAMCIQPEADYRPLMIDVVQSLMPLVKYRSM